MALLSHSKMSAAVPTSSLLGTSPRCSGAAAFDAFL
jgi:hypothetical protein